MAKASKVKKSLSVAIIAVVILIMALYLFTTSQEKPNIGECITTPHNSTYSPYICDSMSYSHITGNITLKFGQDTGTNWTTANMVFVFGTLESNMTPDAFNQSSGAVENGNVIGQLPSGKMFKSLKSVTLPVSSPISTLLGTVAEGALWVAYSTSQNSTPHFVRVAVISTKAI